MKVKLGEILYEEKETIGKPDGDNLDLIGVSNDIGLQLSRAKRIADLSRYKLIENNWFAYNPMRINVGSIGYAFKEEHIGIVSPDYVVFSCSDKILPEYLLFLLKSEEGLEAIGKNASGAVRKRLYFQNLANIEIELPNLDTQKKKIEIFKRVKELGKSHNSQLRKDGLMIRLQESIIQEAIQGKLTEDWRKKNPKTESAEILLDHIRTEKEKLIKAKKIKKEKPLPEIKTDETPFDLPKGWVWSRVQSLGQLKSGNSYKYEKGTESDIPYVKVGDMNIKGNSEDVTASSNYFKYVKKMENDFIPTRSIIFPKRGGAIATNKRCKVLSKKILIDSNSMALTINSNLDFNFFYWWFKSIDLSQLGSEAIIPQINNKDILPIVLPLPPYEEQKVIAKKIDNIMQKYFDLRKELNKGQEQMTTLFQAVLKEAFETKN